MAFSEGWSIISIIFYKDIGLNYFEISIVIALTPLFTLLFEIPTGIFSDKYGRKISIVLAFVLCFISALILLNATSMYELIITSITYGASFGFWSGASEAILYESVPRANREKMFLINWSKTILIWTFFGGLSQFMIPNLYDYNKDIPFYIMIFVGFTLSILSMFLKDNFKHKVIEKKHWFEYIKNASNMINKNNELLIFFYFNAIWKSSLLIFAVLLIQPYIEERYTLFEYSLIFGISTLIQSLVITKNKSIVAYLSNKEPLILMALIWTFMTILLAYSDNIYSFTIILSFIWIVNSVFSLLMDSKVNNLVIDKYRSTIFSIFSMIQSLVFVIISLITGYVLLFNSLEDVLLFYAVFSLVSALSIRFILKKDKINA